MIHVLDMTMVSDPTFDEGNETQTTRVIDYRYGRPRSPPSHRGGAPRVADPWTMDFPTNFRHFSDWLRATHPEDYAEAEAAKDGGDEVDENPNGLKARYEKYRRTIVANQVC